MVRNHNKEHIMNITEHVSVLQGKEGVVFVTRPSLLSGISHTAPFAGVSFDALVEWITARENGRRGTMVQDAFPNLTAAEREFLMTGITDEEWKKAFPPEEPE
jgi:hypothetical protein